MKPDPTPIPASALRCPYHQENLTDYGRCQSCVRAARAEAIFFGALFVLMVVFGFLLVRVTVVRVP